MHPIFTANNKHNIRLGLMPPLTGIVGLYGAEIVRAARIACDEINERGGILDSRLQLVVEDDGSLPQTAVPAAERLIDEHGCVAIIGNLLSNSRIDVAYRVAEPRRIPYLNFSFYEGSIASRYFFHFAALPNQQINKMIPYMANLHGPKFYFAGLNYEWPRGSIDACKRSLNGFDGVTVGEEYFDFNTSIRELEELIGRVSRSGADLFVPYFAGIDQIRLLQLFAWQGLKDKMAVVMGHYDEQLASSLTPDVREGYYSVNSYFMSVDTDANTRLLHRLARYPDVSGIWPNGNGIVTNFGEATYIAVHAFAAAVERAGTTESEALVDALEKSAIDAPQGRVCIDPSTHHAEINSYLSRCLTNGRFEIIESFGPIAPYIPERYREGIESIRLHESPPEPQLAARVAAESATALRRLSSAEQILSIADMAVIACEESGTITDANRGASKLFGYEPSELVGMSIHLLLPPYARRRHIELFEEFIKSEEMERRMAQRNQVMGYRKDGSFFPAEASIAKFQYNERWTLVVTLHDITERQKAEDELTYRATHDTLTDLPNRALIRERITHALERSRRHGLNVGLLFIDLDGFKLINDTHGHEAGDRLLIEIANRLVAQARPGDTVARLSGDEFVLLTEHLESESILTTLAGRINESLRKPVALNANEVAVSCSVGIALGHGSTHTADDLLRSADTAMYAAKQGGRDSWELYSDSLQDQAHQRLAITQGLRNAVERGELYCLFQPIIESSTERRIGMELLLRWHSPQGEVSPSLFIPVAEISGSIGEIGEWAFRAGCEALVRWTQKFGEATPYISINLSARQLSNPDLVENFRAILNESGADPLRIVLEITETSLMADVDANLRILHQLNDLGIRIAVDDFGTGYSSLAQLIRLPVTILKIDRAFIDGIEKSEQNRAVVRAIAGLGNALNLTLVAEGVETEKQADELRNLGIHAMQGYLFSRPVPESTALESIPPYNGARNSHANPQP